MPEVSQVRRTDDVAVLHSVCSGGPADVEIGRGWELVFVRRGVFRRETADGHAVADATTAYVGRPGQHQRIHHVESLGDAAHVIALSSRLVEDVAEDLPVLPVRLQPAVEVSVRALSARHGLGEHDDLAIDEVAVGVLGAFLAQATTESTDPGPARRGAVAAVRERLACEVAAGARKTSTLADLAAQVGYAPHHLSRVFAAVTGTTISRYRRALRARSALACLEEGADDLATLAADLGFADHSHLVRSMRAEFGMTPTALRRLLSGRTG